MNPARWLFDVIRLSGALAANTVLLNRAKALVESTSVSASCLICGEPRPKGAMWIHTCDECLSNPKTAIERYRLRTERNSQAIDRS